MKMLRCPMRISGTAQATAAAMALALWSAPGVLAAGEDFVLSERRIGYVIHWNRFAIYESSDEGKAECPNGADQLGPREQYTLQFPNDGTKRTVAETSLTREANIWWPSTTPEPFPFSEAGGKISVGLDLDGKTDPTDFTSPDGRPGIDNQLFRALGCVNAYRRAGSLYAIDLQHHQKMDINRIMIELTDVDSLANDDDVTVSIYRGRDSLLSDATGDNFAPYGTQRVDTRFGKEFINHTKGKIVNGVLTSQPMDIRIPHEVYLSDAGYDLVRDARFELTLTPEKAEGLIGGYADIESIYHSRSRTWPTHNLAYSRQSQNSVYRALVKHADAYPDPKTGQNTAISMAYSTKMSQVHIIHPNKEVSQRPATPADKQKKVVENQSPLGR